MDTDTGTVQLRHDCLLTAWPRLREAVDDAAAEDSLRRHLHRSANAWVSNGRSASTLYHGARLAAALDWAERRGRQLPATEREFLAASETALLTGEAKRRRRNLMLWRWVAGTTLLALLATAIATVSVALHVRTADTVQRSDAAQLGGRALAEPDLRRALLLAVAATRLDATQGEALRTVLGRGPDLVALAGPEVTTAATSPDGKTLAVGTTGGAVLLLDGSTLTRTATLDLPGHGPVSGLAFTPEGDRLVSWGRGEASIVVWDLGTGRPDGAPFGQAWPGTGGLLADGTTLVLTQHSGDTATVVAWDIDARTPSTAYPLPSSTVDRVVVSPDGTLVALGSGGSTVVASPADGTTRVLPGAVTPLAFSPGGDILLTAMGTQVQVWDLTTAEPRAPRLVVGHRYGTLGAAWAPDGSTFATVGGDGVALVWGAADLAPRRSFTTGATPLARVSFAPDQRTLFAVGTDGSVVAFDLAGGRGVGTGLPDANPGLLTLACRLAGSDEPADLGVGDVC
jgi:WD40 repeat protein